MNLDFINNSVLNNVLCIYQHHSNHPKHPSNTVATKTLKYYVII